LQEKLEEENGGEATTTEEVPVAEAATDAE